MIDPHTVDQPFGVEAQRQGVDQVEHLLAFDPHAGEFGDVEEAPPVDLVSGRPPPGQPIVLPLQQVVQPRAALRLAAVERRGRIALRSGDVLVLGAQREAMCVVGPYGQFARGGVAL